MSAELGQRRCYISALRVARWLLVRSAWSGSLRLVFFVSSSFSNLQVAVNVLGNETVHTAGNKHVDFFPVPIFFSLPFWLGELQVKTTK